MTAPYRPDNPFAGGGRTPTATRRRYRPDNPFATDAEGTGESGGVVGEVLREDAEALRAPSAAPAPPAGRERPGIGEQVLGGVEAVGHAVRHPIETVKAMATGIVRDARDTFRPVLGQGEMPGSTRFGDEGAIARSRSGFEVTRENTPGALTPGEHARAAINTAANAALGPATLVGDVVAGGVLGAINDPEQPFRGATAGALTAGTIRGGRAVVRGVRGARQPAPSQLPEAVAAGLRDRVERADAQLLRGVEYPGDLRVVGVHRRPGNVVRENAPGTPAALAEPASFGAEPTGLDALAEDLGVGRVEAVRRRPRAEVDADRARRLADAILAEQTAPSSPLLNAPDSPAAAAAPVSVGTDLDALRRRAEELGVEQVTAVRRRPRIVQEALAETEALGARRQYRPDNPFAPPPRPPVEPPPDAAAVSIGPEDFRQGPAPVVSANGRFDARPGVLRKVNRELAAGAVDKTAEAIGGAGLPTQDSPDARRPRGRAGAAPPPVIPDDLVERARTGAPLTAAELQLVQQDPELRAIRARAVQASPAAPPPLLDEPAPPAPPAAAAPARAPRRERQPDAVNPKFRLNTVDDLQARLREIEARMEDYGQRPETAMWTRFDDDESIMRAGNTAAGRRLGDDARLADEVRAELRARGVDVDAPPLVDEDFTPLEEPFDPRPLVDVPAGGEGVPPRPAMASDVEAPRQRSDAEYLNVPKFGQDDSPLGRAVSARVQERVARLRAEGMVDKGYQSFAEQTRLKDEFARKLLANPLEIDRAKLTRLDGYQVVALHDVVNENTAIVEAASRAVESGTLAGDDLTAALRTIDEAQRATDEALSAIVTEKAQTARSLGYFRQLARQSTDPAVWIVHAKKLLGDKPMPDGVMVEIRRLAKEATDVCGGGA